MHCTLQCMSCGWPSPVQAVLVIGSSRHLLSLPRSLCGAVLGGLLCAASWLRGGELGIESVGVSGGHKGGKQCAVVGVVTADKLGISCVLPALTCWVELCTDHTCIRPWVLLALQLMHNILTLYMCTDVGRPCFHMYNNHTVLNGVKLLQLLHVLYDHTCIRPWVLLALQLMHNILTLYMCTDVGRPCFHMYNNHTVLNGVKLLQLLHVL